MILYYLFVAPLVFIMEYVFEWAFGGTNNYGVSILILSLVVNIILLPLYHLAEKWQKDERYLQAKMKKEIDYIKKYYVRYERMAMLNIVHRLHKYRPILAVRTSFGFLIQVPFFFAAYYYLSHYHFISTKVSFLFFDDLSKPDGLLKIGTLAINVMPFVMTVVNLFSAFVYTQDLKKKDTIQLVGLAALFLVVLYNSPLALVLYWTTNNVFSLGKNIVYSYLKDKKEPLNKEVLSKRKDRKGRKQYILDILSFAFLFSLIYLFAFLTSIAYYYSRSKDAQLQAVLCVIALLSILTVVNCIWIQRNFKEWFSHRVKSLVSILCIVLTSVFVVVFFFKTNHLFIYRRNITIVLILFNLMNSRWLVQYFYNIIKSRIKSNLQSLSTYCLVLVVILTCIYFPLALVYRSFTHANLVKVLKELIPLTSLLLLIVFYINYLVPKRWKTIFHFISIVSTFVLLAYAFIFKGNYGVFWEFTLSHAKNLYKPYLAYIDIGLVFVISSLICIFLFNSKGIKFVKNIVVLLIVAVLIGSGYYYINSTPKPVVVAKSKIQKQETDELLSFSKDKQNVIVFMLDGFTNEFVGEMIKEKYKYLDAYSGFTWYSNSSSTGGSTYPGLLGLIGGPKHTSYQQNLNPKTTIYEAYRQNYNRLTTLFRDNNYDVSFLYSQFAAGSYSGKNKCDKKRLYFDHCEPGLYQKKYSYTPYWSKFLKDKMFHIRQKSFLFVSMLGLFRVTPYSMRQYVYNHGDYSYTSNNYLYTAQGKGNFLVSLPYLSNLKAKKATFKFFQIQITHPRWNYDPKQCIPSIENTRYISDYTKENHNEAHYSTGMCTIRMLSHFLVWLKKNQIYDNTKIILVADHSFGDDRISKAYYQKTKHDIYIGSLLLVKDFNTKNKKIRINKDIFTSNIDMPAIASDGLQGSEALYGKNILKYPIKNRVIHFIKVSRSILPNKYLGTLYEIKNNVFDVNNIKKIKEIKK